MPSHLQSATIQAAILNISSSVLAQLLTAYRNADPGTSSSSLNPLGLDFVAILQYLISNLLLTPPNFLWQEYLEKTFPGYPVQKGKQKMKVDEDGNGIVIEQKLDLRNTAIKFGLDQTLGAIINTALFLFLIKLLRGGSLESCFGNVLNEFWPIMIAGYKLWPLVSIFNFTVVPMERRVVVGSLVGLGWGVYIALKTAA